MRPARRLAATLPAAMARPPPLATVPLAADVAPASLHARYKRFLADVSFGGGAALTTVHCPNTGPMVGLLDALPAPALAARAANAATRKYAHTLVAIRPTPSEPWVGVHSAAAIGAVAALIEQGALEGLRPKRAEGRPVSREVKYGPGGRSRADMVLHTGDGGAGGDVVIEVKSVSLAAGAPASPAPRRALFPDTVSARASRHAADLAAVARAGRAAALIFLVQRGDCASFSPASSRDPAYAAALTDAAAAGVTLIALGCEVRHDPDARTLVLDYRGPLPIDLRAGSEPVVAAAKAEAAAQGKRRRE